MSGPLVEPRIARATDADAARIASLHATLFESPWSTETFALMLARENVIGLVAGDAGRAHNINGFAFVQTILDEAELMSIGVARPAQRRGLGDALMRAVIVHAAAAGARAVHLEVATINAAASALYARHGFRQVGLRKGYYATPDGRLDALLMRAEIR